MIELHGYHSNDERMGDITSFFDLDNDWSLSEGYLYLSFHHSGNFLFIFPPMDSVNFLAIHRKTMVLQSIVSGTANKTKPLKVFHMVSPEGRFEDENPPIDFTL